MSQFNQPGIGGDKFTAAEHNGALLLVFPTVFRSEVPTSNGVTDCVDARIVNLNTGQVLDDARIFGTALVTQLKGSVPDGMVLGRLGQGQNTKGNPPWVLNPHTEQDVQVAEAWLAANPRNQFGQPAGNQAPPTPPAYGQQGTGGWGQQAAPQASPAPATGGWGAPPPAAQYNPQPQAQAPAQGGWGAPAPTPAPVAAPPVDAGVDPGLVAALAQRGINLPPGTSQQVAEQIAASVGLTRG